MSISFRKFQISTWSFIFIYSLFLFNLASSSYAQGILYFDPTCYNHAFGVTYKGTNDLFTYRFSEEELKGYYDPSNDLVVGLCTVPPPDGVGPAGYLLRDPDGPINCAIALGDSTYTDVLGGVHDFVDPENTSLFGLPFNLNDLAIACRGAGDDGVTNFRANCIYNYMTNTANLLASAADAFKQCDFGTSESDFVPAPVHHSGESSLKGAGAVLTGAGIAAFLNTF